MGTRVPGAGRRIEGFHFFRVWIPWHFERGYLFNLFETCKGVISDCSRS